MKAVPLLLASFALLLLGCGDTMRESSTSAAPETEGTDSMQIHYLEIVTPEVDSVCATYERLYGLSFGEPVPELGNARTADLPEGGRVGVRGPMRESEEPVVRPYVLVDDIEAAVQAAEEAGAEIALPPMELPGQGTCAIYIEGGIQHGLWQR